MLLLGDPGTAKSQLLKFVEKVSFLKQPNLTELGWAHGRSGRAHCGIYIWEGAQRSWSHSICATRSSIC